MTTPATGHPRWLSEDDQEAWTTFASMLIWLPTALDEQLQQDSGMSHFEYGILSSLSEADGATLRMSELAIYANGSLSRLSRAVARLEDREWVTRKPDPSDGRYTLAVLTDSGRAALVEAAPGACRGGQPARFRCAHRRPGTSAGDHRKPHPARHRLRNRPDATASSLIGRANRMRGRGLRGRGGVKDCPCGARGAHRRQSARYEAVAATVAPAVPNNAATARRPSCVAGALDVAREGCIG